LQVDGRNYSAVASGKLKGNETITVGTTMSSERVSLNVTIYSRIELQ
jgi:hypothetical protein